MLKQIMSEIIQNRILPESINHWGDLKGGTDSTVGVIGSLELPNMYVVKSNSPVRIAAETRFYQMYREISLLPIIKYVDPDYRYFIYEFIPGNTRYTRKNKHGLMSDLIKLMIRYYKNLVSWDDYEWVEDPTRVAHDINYSQSIIGFHLNEEDHVLVKDIHIRRRNRISEKDLYVLHGDFGVHNFLFENDTLQGIIDPFPAKGRRLYDLLYAFCSSPDDLHFSILLNVVEQAGIERISAHNLVEDMILALYFRIATCLKHHPEDLSQYQNAWKEWKQLISSS
jgi:hypothetical protein